MSLGCNLGCHRGCIAGFAIRFLQPDVEAEIEGEIEKGMLVELTFANWKEPTCCLNSVLLLCATQTVEKGQR